MNPARVTAKKLLLQVSVPETYTDPFRTVVELKPMVDAAGGRYSENALATRCNELEHDGLFVGRYRQGTDQREYAKVVGEPRPRAAKAPKPAYKIVSVQRLIGGDESIIIEAPAGTFRPGMTVRAA